MFLLLLALAPGASAWYNGTPTGVPPSFDCAARALAYSYGRQLAPHRGQFASLYDALQLANCDAVEPPTELDTWQPPTLSDIGLTEAGAIQIHVDATTGDDANGGRSELNPLRTIHAALAISRAIVDDFSSSQATPRRHIVLRGKHHLTAPIAVTAHDSGLHFRNAGAGAEPAVLTGAKPLPNLQWKPYRPKPKPPRPPTLASFLTNENNVYNDAHAHSDSPGITFFGVLDTPTLCQGACNGTASCLSWTWHPNTSAMGDYKLNCFGRTTPVWQPRAQAGIVSGQSAVAPAPAPAFNGWVADLSAAIKPGQQILGLRVSGQRAIRARFPNGNPETASSFPPWVDNGYGGIRANFGWLPLHGAVWTPQPDRGPATDLQSGPADWPGVEWPSIPIGHNAAQTGSGDYGTFNMGTGGQCATGLPGTYDPPYGYYCANHPPRGSQYKHNPPVAVAVPAGMLPNAPYASVKGAVIHSWMPEHWYSNSYAVGAQTTARDGTVLFNFSSGGFQGSIGQGGIGGEWFMENVLEELDSPMEWYHDADQAKLYYVHNGTGAIPPALQFEAVTTKVLLNVTGTQDNPVTDFSLRGVVLRDTAYTYLDPHGAPSGGDWGLQRSGAVTLAGTDGAVIDSSLFTRLDGLGVFIAGYNRDLTISNSTFEWIGGSAMAAWGDTSTALDANGTITIPWPRGPDARCGNQPIGTKIVGNIVTDVGIWQKQSSMWFQATTAQSLIKGNVHFNGPRAGININDGMGGGDEITENLLLNTCRESGDHGPVNSWDRAPYITTIGLHAPKASVFPQFRNIHHNFMIANYNSQEAIDNDDGSSFYNTHHNFFVYGDAGLKSDFGGHDNHHHGNIYAYFASAFGKGTNLWFVNNTCVFRGRGGYGSDCGLQPGMQVSGNAVYVSGGNLEVCGGTPLDKWVAEGHDNGTTLHNLPSDAALIAMARTLLTIQA